MKDEVPQTGFGSRKRTLPVTVAHDWMGSSEIHGGDDQFHDHQFPGSADWLF